MVCLLDTNVVSELMRPEPSPAVLAWIDGAGMEGLALSAVNRWETRYGLALLPVGKRQVHREIAGFDEPNLGGP
ncbi:PIN domain-containing protein [Thiocapsa rosea]|uniref:PIN domain-containing protein n=1 Tax=Thiocapsa rosea TaxID=69360 RepID=A0A495V8E4_9GAMM|nr:PIN domain-containing protein [Thiocapsa rosea]RKT44637.1 PIN domain-containing protein [Thiocapsa rosea]